MYKRNKYRGLFVKSAIDGDCIIVPLNETKMYEERLSYPDFESNLLLQNVIKKLPRIKKSWRPEFKKSMFKKSICLSSTFELKIKKVKSFSTHFFLYGENIRECPMRHTHWWCWSAAAPQPATTLTCARASLPRRSSSGGRAAVVGGGPRRAAARGAVGSAAVLAGSGSLLCRGTPSAVVVVMILVL